MSSINDYYEEKLRKARVEILSNGDSYILNVETEKLVNYYYDKDALPMIEKDSSKIMELSHHRALASR